MKICKIYIGDYKQFKRLELDFTHPETGEPLDKICFIGRNGTGKSNLLEYIKQILRTNGNDFFFNAVVKIEFSGKQFLMLNHPKGRQIVYISLQVDKEEKFIKEYFDFINSSNYTSDKAEEFIKTFIQFEKKNISIFDDILSDNLKNAFYSNDEGDKLLISVLAENVRSSYSQILDVPETSLNQALDLFRKMPSVSNVSADFVEEFWKQLNYLIKKREDNRNQFEELPENLSKTKRELIELFRVQNPEILQKLAELWNKILDSAGLEFDYKRAKNPVQLNDNLKAYIILKKTGKIIKYSELSTGIRNFIFKIGHIYSLYFNRKIDQGFLLVDEPENSLFPDFLYDLIDIYKEITTDKDGNNNTQMFFATHSPIIAAQFEPYERVILEWNDEGTISAHRGVAPVGDDPNDVLKKDFEIRSLMTQKGLEAWDEYLKLKKEIRTIQDEPKKKELMEKLMQIGTAYNFH